MRKILIIALMAALLVIAGCGPKISDIRQNTDDYLGKEVTITGEAINTIRLGELSGFTLNQDGDTIPVMSKTIPAEGSDVKVKGTVVKSMLGLYIQASKVS